MTTPNPDHLEQFLRDHFDDFIWWSEGNVVFDIRRYWQFRSLGGDFDLLVSCFEDYGDATDARRHYIAALRGEE